MKRLIDRRIMLSTVFLLVLGASPGGAQNQRRVAPRVARAVLKVKPKVYLQGLNVKAKHPLVRNYNNIKELQFDRSRGASPFTFRQYSQKYRVAGPLVARQLELAPIRKVGIVFARLYSPALYPNGKVVLAVNSGLYPSINNALTTYIDDIAAQGYYGQIHTVSAAGTPAQLRTYLQNVTDLAGVVLIGQLPVAWFEHDQDFCGPGQPATCHAEFPCDLFYQDLDGNWTDTDGDGIYNTHTGNTSPEIFLGRLAAYTLPGNEATYLNDYFAKDHRFRTGEAGFSARGMTFVDDDWSDFGKSSMDLYLDIVDAYCDQNFTTAANYKDKLKSRLAWMQLCCHSSPTSHHFKKPGGDGGYVFSADLQNTNHPQAFFHNLFCCSSADFNVNNYAAGWYTFGNSFGLCTVGSTKTGSMRFFEYFYGAMGDGLTIGEAMVAWWDAIQPIDADKRAWHYGMTVIGEPLLHWRVGAIPHSLNPTDGSSVHLPGAVTLSWSAITNFGAVTYKVESQYWDAAAKQWKLKGGTNTATSSVNVNMANTRHRWRVKAYLKGQWGPWSPWQYLQPI